MKTRKSLAIIIALIMCIALSACSCEETTSTEPEKHVPAGFIEIAYHRVETTYSWVNQYLFYDPETTVMYAYIDEGDGGAITVLYNADGTLRIYTPYVEA